MSIIGRLEWDEWNIDHVARHGVTPEEVEEACFSRSIFRKTRKGRYWVYGRSSAGRYLFIVVEPKPNGVTRCVTARTMTIREKRYYKQRALKT